jgi:lysophospholipase L1-like esterase
MTAAPTPPTPPSPPTAPRWAKRALLLSLSTLFTLALAECSVRAYFWSKGIGRGNVREILERSQHTELPELHGGAGLFGRMEPSPHPNVIYQLKPHLKGTLLGAVVQTNRFGLRGPEIKKSKPAKTYRLVGLGDSHMFGWAVAQGEEYMALLERKLNEYADAGYRFETLNFGTPGYNTVMEVAAFEHRALEFQPDLVLLHFVGNDLFAPHFLQPPRGLAPSNWYLVELLRGLAGSNAAAPVTLDNADAEEPEQPEERSTRAQRRSEYSHLAGREAFAGAMARLAELAHVRALPVLQFSLGQRGEQHVFAREQALANGFRVLNVQPSFAALMTELGVEDGSARFKELFVRDQHPSPLGHQAYARALFCELQRMQIPHLVPAPAECAWEVAGSAVREAAAP